MTHCLRLSCKLFPMRTAFLSLLASVFALGVLRAQPVLTLEAATDRTLYLADTTNTVYVEAKVRAAAPPESANASVRNIVFVLDRSGSMAGEPIQALRQAMSVALGSLAERDVVSVILFGSEVETLLESKRRDQIGDLDALLAKIEPAGGAALYDALNQGAAQLRRYASTSTINHLVLLTDGPATKGPRERDDFTRLAELFAREGFTLSTIGLSDEFDEDLLVAMARIGNGHFRYAAQPAKLVEAFQAEIAPLRTPLAQDVVLTLDFAYGCDEIESVGWRPAAITERTAAYRFPFLYAGQDLSVLVGTAMRAMHISADVATVRLQWKDVATGTVHETSRKLSVVFDQSPNAVRKSVNRGVLRTTVNALVSEGMQHAIEQLDKGDFRRALRELHKTRAAATSMNADLEDAEITAKIQVLETYLAEVQSRGLNQLDRKILRSGLHNQFEIPTGEPTDK